MGAQGSARACTCTVAMFDAYELRRFSLAQVDAFPRAIAELRAGRKRTVGCGLCAQRRRLSSTGKRWAAPRTGGSIRSAEEGCAYLRFRDGDVDLRANYLEVLGVVADQLASGRTLVQLFGRADAPKFKSSVEFFKDLGDSEVSEACDAVCESAVDTGPSYLTQDARNGGFASLLCSWIGL